MNNCFIILAGGESKRFNSKTPKSYTLYKGKALLLHSIDKAKSYKKFDKIVLVINKKHKLIGIITDGDLRKKMNNKLFNLTASEIMTKKPTTGDKNMLVGEVLNIMNTKKITNLFICEKNKPIGIIHIHDLLRLSS